MDRKSFESVKAVPAALVRIYYFVKTQIIILNPPPLALRVWYILHVVYNYNKESQTLW